MRAIAAIIAVLGVLGAAAPAPALGFSGVEAINRCEAFVDAALREEFSAEFKMPYKVTCYFGLIDPGIDADPEGACARAARALAGAHREIAVFSCLGAYRGDLIGEAPAN